MVVPSVENRFSMTRKRSAGMPLKNLVVSNWSEKKKKKVM